MHILAKFFSIFISSMKNPANTLRTAYFNALNGVVKVNGANVKIYRKIISANAPSIYVSLSTETGRKERSKSRDLREHTLLIDIVTKFPAYEGDEQIVNDIQEQISQIVDNGTQLDLSPTFQCVLTVEEDSHDIDVQTPTETIIRKLIRYRHTINIINA